MFYVFRHKADVSVANAAGLAPLHVAIKRNAYPCVHVLAGAGADVNALNPTKETPMYMAGEFNHYVLPLPPTVQTHTLITRATPPPLCHPQAC